MVAMRFTPSDVNMARVQAQLETLAQIGRQPSGGVTRFTFSPEHMQATHTVAGWMAEAGLEVVFDRWGNLIGRMQADGRLVLSGSHLDSVPNGGHFDGVLGVIAALEAVTLIMERGVAAAKPLGVVSFIEEEGARFHGLMGSKLATGKLSGAEIAAVEDAGGNRFLDILHANEFAHPVRDVNFETGVSAFLELHIEQGKRLEKAGVPIGIVTSIAGPTFLQVSLAGQADHAGATEYADRRDSLLAAADFIVALREMAVSRFAGRGHMTVGKIDVRPNVTNVVAGETVFNIDFRAADHQAYDEMAAGIDELLGDIAARHPISYSTDVLHHTPPVVAREHIRAALEAGADSADVRQQPLVSWAAHDAMNMAAVADAGMIFVPCRDGRSHTPEEYVGPDDIAAGIAVLANALLSLALEVQ
jgi:allantoate deiminase